MPHVSKLDQAVSAIRMPIGKYAATVVLPVGAASVLVAVLAPLLLPETFGGLLILVPIGIPVLAVGGIVAYPFLLAQQRGQEIDHNMHYFISHLGTLSTSRIPPVDLFATIGEKTEEYGALAEECERVAMLVNDWNMSLAGACRFVAQRTPSSLFSDFLERFAFGLESGTDIEAYLRSEQDVVMADYESLYKKTLQSIDDLQSLYNGAMMTIIFLVMFVLLMVVLVDFAASAVMVMVILLTLAIGGLFLLLAKIKVPSDPIWTSIDEPSPLWARVKVALPAAVGACLALAAALYVVPNGIPHPFRIAIAGTPLLVPGLLATREEQKVKRRDHNFPGFMRSLGSSTAARGGDDRSVLRHLRLHDFGPLTDNLRDLFRRLQVRVDDEAAWRYFTTEAGSRLIERFTDMYNEATDAGGRPDAIGRIISDSMVQIIGLRKLRYQQAGTFRGVVFTVAVGSAFALAVGIGVLDLLSGLFTEFVSLDNAPVAVPTFVHVDNLDLPVLNALALVILGTNAAISSMLVRIVDGGTHVRDLGDFSLLVWISNGTLWLATTLMTAFIGTEIAI